MLSFAVWWAEVVRSFVVWWTNNRFPCASKGSSSIFAEDPVRYGCTTSGEGERGGADTLQLYYGERSCLVTAIDDDFSVAPIIIGRGTSTTPERRRRW